MTAVTNAVPGTTRYAARGETASAPRVVLHLGAHKTGTTLVQSFLRGKKSALADQGVKYVSRSRIIGHLGGGRLHTSEPELGAMVERFAGKFRTTVISYEGALGGAFRGRNKQARDAGLYPNAPRALHWLRASVGGFRPTVIYYIRNQDELIDSYYIMLVKRGLTAPFEKWFRGIDLQNLSWRPVIADLQQAFGAGNVIVADFSEIARGQDAFIRCFLNRVEPSLELPVSGFSPKYNAGYSQAALKIALLTNRFLGPRVRHHVRRTLEKGASNRRFSRPALLSAKHKRHLAELYHDENRALRTDNTPGLTS